MQPINKEELAQEIIDRVKANDENLSKWWIIKKLSELEKESYVEGQDDLFTSATN